MPYYRQLGKIPPKRHTKLPLDPATSYKGEGLAYEHVITTQGFDRVFSILYHLKPPTRVKRVEHYKSISMKAAAGRPLRHHHLKSRNIPRKGDPYLGRIPLMFNKDMICYRCRPETAFGPFEFYRNGAAEEIIFVNKGGGVLESFYGKQPYREGDYIVIPRSTIYRLVPDNVSVEDYLILESFNDVHLPQRYLTPEGQIKMDAPFAERDLHGPMEIIANDEEGDFEILIKDSERYTRHVLAHHPFDVIGWDGMLYPYTFNVHDFEPITGTTHQPPPIHQTFECKGYVVCTFAPRFLDHHPDAIKVPYVHDNVGADEVLFYVSGNFGSRRGIEEGSLTLHPQGIPHGPHPGTILASMGATRTEELAVMFDTEFPLHLTEEAMALDDPEYPLSWVD